MRIIILFWILTIEPKIKFYALTVTSGGYGNCCKYSNSIPGCMLHRNCSSSCLFLAISTDFLSASHFKCAEFGYFLFYSVKFCQLHSLSASNVRILVNDELWRMWKEDVVINFKINLNQNGWSPDRNSNPRLTYTKQYCLSLLEAFYTSRPGVSWDTDVTCSTKI
jgi:hypothetical protein